MITKQEIKEHIEGYCKELRLPAIRHSFEEDAREADLNNYAYEEFLYYLLQKESDLRRENGKKNRIRLAFLQKNTWKT
jgi:DNA replication protein DnaC